MSLLGVGCGQLVYHKNGRLISIEGDPKSPISRGRLCPKGADTFELHTHPGRLKKVKYRRPYSRQWEELDQETAMDMVADRLWESRERTFQIYRSLNTLECLERNVNIDRTDFADMVARQGWSYDDKAHQWRHVSVPLLGRL